MDIRLHILVGRGWGFRLLVGGMPRGDESNAEQGTRNSEGRSKDNLSLSKYLCQCSDEMLRKTVFEGNREAIECCIPILYRHGPFLRGFADRQVDDLNSRLLRRKDFSVADRFADHAVD